MSEQLRICLIAVAVNLGGMLVIYSIMGHAFARLAWHQRGVLAVVALIVVAQLFWIAPAIWIVEADRAGIEGLPFLMASYALWFGNWLVTGFSLVLFPKSAARIPIALGDAAQMDGLGGVATWRRTVLPFVRGDLVLVGLLTVMATLLPFWSVINQPAVGSIITFFERGETFGQHLAAMFAASLVGVVP